MTRRSKRELERTLDDLEPRDGPLPDDPSQDWMQYVPRELWADSVAALRYWSKKADEAENDA